MSERTYRIMGWFDVEVINFGGFIGIPFLMTPPSNSANTFEINALFSISVRNNNKKTSQISTTLLTNAHFAPQIFIFSTIPNKRVPNLPGGFRRHRRAGLRDANLAGSQLDKKGAGYTNTRVTYRCVYTYFLITYIYIHTYIHTYIYIYIYMY